MICIYHKNCADGFGAAWVVNQKYQNTDRIEFIPAHYGDNPPDVKGQDVIIVDFSYPYEILEQMEMDAKSILVIDHHKTAKQHLENMNYAIFDMNKCGAILTWQHFFRDKAPPLLLLYIQDGDLWNWELPQSREVSAALRSYPFDFEVWDEFMEDNGVQSLMVEGKAILRYQQQQVDAALSHDYELVEIGGYQVPCLNSTHLISEIGNELCKEHPFAACYFDTVDKRVFSLRSINEGMDVSEIAKQYGGGGHRNAAGFTVDKPKILGGE